LKNLLGKKKTNKINITPVRNEKGLFFSLKKFYHKNNDVHKNKKIYNNKETFAKINVIKVKKNFCSN
jgi:hypothetical protein